MGNTKHTIEINSVLKTTLGNVDSTIKELQNKLRSGDLQIDLTKGVGKDLSKLVSNFETSFSKINQMTPDNLLNILDSKEFQKEGTSIIKTIQEIQRIVNDVGTKSMIDAKKLFPNAFDGRVTELQGLIQNVSTSLESLTKKEATFNKLNTEIAGLTARIQELDEAAANQGQFEEEWSRAAKAVEATNTAVNNLRENLRGQLELKIQQNSVDKTEQKIEELNKELEEFANKGVTTGKGGRGVFQGKGIGDWEKIAKNGTLEEKAQAQAALELLRNYNSVNSALKEQKTLLEDVKKAQELLNQSPQLSDNKSLKEAGSILEQKEEVTNALEQQTNATNRATQAQQKLTQAENASAQKQELQQQIIQKTQHLKELETAMQNLRTNSDLGTLTQKFNELTGLNLAPIKENLQIMLKKLREIDDTSYENLKASLQKLGVVLPETKQDVDNLRNSFRQGETDVKNFNNRLNEVEQLKTRMAYFFGLTNSIQLFRRAVTQALNTVKELDATMTEAAVVTDFSVSDMWEKLPEYSASAQQLGVSINGMYQATTLYYQQGLKNNEAMALGIETMKMGKIASMDSTEATKAMTAALRGFNMELNELSATRVNDVYSQLAAVTAADTSQIATAMEKTASIAANANMEFETTAALLAQIIETTQEAPETAGTAMKTIIARFSEVKSLRDQGQTSGKDSEGEDIDVNKIQTALGTVGISMEGFFAGTERLDSVLLKLAEKWKSLDFETQRYIATMAAGSRQQSRFIAMMSDYDRTMELVDEAQNSAGASQRQFEKTLDSMESKLQRLENAWKEFLMGLSNNEVLKGAITILTSIIEGINGVTEAFSGGNGLLKALTSLVTVIGALKIGRGLVEGILADKGVLTNFSKTAKSQAEAQAAQQSTIPQSTSGQIPPTEQVVSNPDQQGRQAGRKFGLGFIEDLKAAFRSGRREIQQEVAALTSSESSSTSQQQTTKDTSNKKRTVKKSKSNQKKKFSGKKTSRKIASQEKAKNKKQPYQEITTKVTVEGAEEASENLNKVNQQANNAKETLNQTGQNAQNTGQQLKEVGDSATGTGERIQSFSQGIAGLGTSLLGAGMALNLLASLFDSLGMEEAGEVVRDISGAIMMVGTALSVVSGILPVVTALTGAQAAATWSALWPILLIMGALVLIISLIATMIQKAHDSSLEGQMEAAAEATEAAAKAAEDAKKAYSELLENKEEYAEIQENLQNLTKGTEEWKDALLEANEQVLQLLATYPELAKYLDTGEQGQLIIKEEGWEELTNKALQNKRNTTAASQFSARRSAELEYANYLQQTADQIGISQYELISGSKALLSESKEGYNEWLRNLATMYAWDSEKLAEVTTMVANYTSYAERQSINIENFAKAGLTALASEDFLSYEFSDAILTGAADMYTLEKGIGLFNNENYENYEKIFQSEIIDGIETGLVSGLLKEIEIEYIETGDSLKDAQNIYMQMMGSSSIEEIPEEIRENKEELIKVISQVYAGKKSTQLLESIQKSLALRDKETQKQATAVYSQDTGMATLKDYSSDVRMSAGQIADAMGIELEQLASLMGTTSDKLQGTIDAYWKKVGENYGSIFSGLGEGLEGPITALNSKLLELGSISGLTLQQTDALAQSLGRVKLNGGDADALLELFSQSLIGLKGVDLEMGIATLSNVDWTSKDSIDQAVAALRNLGAVIENDFVSKLYDVANATRKFNINSIEQELNKLQNLIDMIETKADEGVKTFTKKERDELAAKGFGLEQFVRTGINDYTFMGTTEELLSMIKDYTFQLLEESRKDTSEAIERGKRYASFASETMAISFGRGGGGKAMTGSEVLSKIADGSLSAERMELGDLQTIGTKLGFDITDDMNKEQIYGLIKEGYADYLALETNQKLFNQYSKDSATMTGYGLAGTQEYENYYIDEINKEVGLDAYIHSQEGLEIAVANTTEQLEKQGMEFDEHSSLIKRLVATNDKANKNMRSLTDTLEDQMEAFKIGDKNVPEYQQALAKVTAAAQDVFGSDITADFVHENRALFEQLAQGGQTAAQAYTQLGEIMAEDYIESLGGSISATNALQAAMNNIPNNLELGASFDATEAMNALMDLGFTAEQAVAYLNKLGFSVKYETRKAWLYDGVLYDKHPGGDPKDVKPVTILEAAGTKLGPSYSPSGGGGGGGSNNYENGYDRLHNTLQEINDVLRERERLERQYQRLLDRNLATAKQLSNISRQNIAAYQFEISKQKDIIAGRIAQIEGEKLGNPDLQNLIYTEQGRDGNQSIRINWERLQAIKNADAGERADEYYNRIQGWLESIYEAQTAIEEAQDAIYEEMSQGKDEYLNLEQQVKEAIVSERQKEIDKLSAINDSINDTNSKLLESMQQQLNEYRQNRDNAKTEDELSDKQRRLAYLQQDTSGANAKDILQLQKEIDEGQQNYTDQLIDQKISELQQQNDKAAEQRQQQIDIMQAQLDKYSESSEIWEDVAELVAEGTSAAEGLVSGSELEALLKSSEAFAGMSKIQKMDWLNQINNQLAAALKWMSDGAVASMNVGKTITFTAKGNSTPITGTVNEQGQVVTEDGAVFNKVSMDAYGNYSTSETMSEALNNQEAEQESKINQEEIAMFPYGKPTQISAPPTYGESSGLIKALQHALNIVGNYNLTVDGVWSDKTSNAIYTFKNKNGLNAWNTPWSDIMKALESKVKEKLKGKMQFTQYKTGGLADFTGPAWLDGTKSRPEYILNADQTKAFFNLIDVLGSLQTSNSKTAQNSGDNTYDIDINVESIGSDYDVEQLATTVKRLINEDARYRNNNAINLMR